MLKIWICGAGGRVGRKMTDILASRPVELLLTDADSVDITDSEAVMEYAHINRPHYIVNCAGLTDAAACEDCPEEAYRVNALGARNLSVAARMGKSRLVQMSTDDVFDGRSLVPYTEFDPVSPRTVYGKSKMAGENFVREFCNRHIIVRSSWIFGDGSPYLERILEMAGQGKTIRAASDQMASPTGADGLAAKVIELMEHGEDGLYHVTGQGCCSRYELAKEAVRLAGYQVPVEPVNASEDTLSSMGDTKKLGKIGIKTLGFYLATTALAITAAILTAHVINPGAGLDLSSLETARVEIGEKEGLADTLLAIIPVNPVRALADGDMLSIILFALIVGIILAGLGEAVQTVGNLFSQFNDVMMQMTVMVMKLAPYGVFCLTARTFSGIGFDAFLPLLKYMAGVMTALAIQGLVVYMAILKGFTGLSPVRFLKKFLPVMGFAFSTATSNATIPMSIDTLHRKMGVSRRISSFTIPLGATINMDGTAIMQGVAVVFASQAFGIRLSVADYLTVILTATLASVGTAGVPGVGLITLSMVFASVGLPVEAIALIMGIDRILDMSRTAVNITGDAVCTTVVAFQDGAVDKAVFDDMEAGRDT